MAFLVPWTFSPPEDYANTQLQIELPPGGTLEDTARVSAAAAAVLRKSPEVTNIIEFIGSSDGLIQNAAIYVSLVPRNQRSMSQKQWEQRMMPLLNQVPDGQLYFSDNGGGRDLQFYLTGDDPPLVEETAHRVIAEMQQLNDIRSPRIRGDLPRPEIIVHPRFDVAARLGVSVESISQTIRIATLGDLPQNGAKFSLSDRQIPIRVSLLESSRRDLTTLENLPVPTSSGGAVPLKTVADLSFGQGPSAVRRYNQTRRVFIEADLSPGIEFGTANKKVYALPTLTHLPQGVHLVPKGDSEYFGEMIKSFGLALGAGILMVLAVLVLLFVRVFQPFTILSALPLSLGGAALALVVTGQPFSLSVVIGILMLMGIVAKNSILLVDFAIEEMRAGKSRMEALLESGHKRARPIVMTSVAMVAGMLPVAIGWGGDSEFRAPMAIAVIGGLLTSTVLTLVVVPAVFTILDDFERWLAPRASRLLGPARQRERRGATPLDGAQRQGARDARPAAVRAPRASTSPRVASHQSKIGNLPVPGALISFMKGIPSGSLSLLPMRRFGDPVLPRRSILDGQRLAPSDPAIYAITDFKRDYPMTVEAERQIDDALTDMIRLGVRALLVAKDQRLVGLVTSYDIQGERPMQFLQSSNYSRHQDIRVMDVMTPWDELVALDWESVESARAGELLAVFEQRNLTHLLVIEVDRQTSHGVVRALASRSRLMRQLGGRRLSSSETRPPCRCPRRSSAASRQGALRSPLARRSCVRIA